MNSMREVQSAIQELTEERRRIDAALTALTLLSPLAEMADKEIAAKGQRRVMSDASRRKIAAAQKKRWAKFRKES